MRFDVNKFISIFSIKVETLSTFINWLRRLWLESYQATINERYAKLIATGMDFTRFAQYSSTFIETGTCRGDSVTAALLSGFTQVKSVELSPTLYEVSKQRFFNDNRVSLFLGKSADRLPEMIKDIPIPSVFWLDAHPAGPGTAGHEEWLKRDESVFQDNVLAAELNIILKHGCHIILIDDQQGWKTANKFASIIESFYPERYEFSLEDEIRQVVHKEKVLVCLPV